MHAKRASWRPFGGSGSRPSSGRRLPAVLVAVSAVLLAACGEDKPREPMVMEPAPAAPGPPIDLDLPLDPSGAFAFDQWPKACDLLTDAAIKAVLPQTTEVKREPEDQEINIISAGSGAPPRAVTAEGAKCSYKLDLPDVGSVAELGGSLLVSVDHAGTPEAVEQNFSADVNDPIEVPDGQCYVRDRSSGVSCRKGPLAFSISSTFFSQEVKDDGTSIDRYRVNGKTTTFTAPVGTSDAAVQENGRKEEFRRDALDVELAKTVLAKV